MKNIQHHDVSQKIDLTVDMLRANPTKNPVLQRLSAKLHENETTGSFISRYDRMHHRHSRS